MEGQLRADAQTLSEGFISTLARSGACTDAPQEWLYTSCPQHCVLYIPTRSISGNSCGFGNRDDHSRNHYALLLTGANARGAYLNGAQSAGKRRGYRVDQPGPGGMHSPTYIAGPRYERSLPAQLRCEVTRLIRSAAGTAAAAGCRCGLKRARTNDRKPAPASPNPTMSLPTSATNMAMA